MEQTQAEWIAVDWGTSNLRAWPMDSHGKALAMLESPKGMGALTPEEFEPTLVGLVDPFLADGSATPVVCCGMVGAAQGWKEAPYAAAPCAPPTVAQSISVETKDNRLDVHILPGVKQMQPADVMRGEETQINGYLSDTPDFDGILCLPGTHTKWASIEGGIIKAFQTFMTGELFAVVSKNSVLRHSVMRGEWDDAAFEKGLSDVFDAPESLTSNLFSIRAETLVAGATQGEATARLSGLLLGAELSGAKHLWDGKQIVLIGSQSLTKHYEHGLKAQGADVSSIDGNDLVLAGLSLAYQSMRST